MKQRWPRVRKRLQGQDRPRQTKTDRQHNLGQLLFIHRRKQCLHIAVFTLLSSLHLMAVLLSALGSPDPVPFPPFLSALPFLSYLRLELAHHSYRVLLRLLASGIHVLPLSSCDVRPAHGCLGEQDPLFERSLAVARVGAGLLPKVLLSLQSCRRGERRREGEKGGRKRGRGEREEGKK